ncbi:MAG: acetate--CoA ligase family protein [Methanomassiliicoccales archaeon]
MTRMSQPLKTLSEAEVKEMLRSRGITTTDFLLPTREELSRISLRYPLAVKVSSPDILHKTEVGGVFLNVSTPQELVARYDEIISRFPQGKVLVESMEKTGPEAIVGLFRDRSFGMSIMTGLGGVMTELFRDVSFRKLPISRLDALEMIEETRLNSYFEGFRGFRADEDAFIDLLLKMSSWVEELKDLEQLDLNPIILREKGYVVLDAKMIIN